MVNDSCRTHSVIKMQDEKTKMFKDQIVYGPIRVFPGRLSVSRAFGDIEAKKPRYGGN